MSKPMTVARYAREHRGWFYGCLLLFALVAFFCLKAIYDMTVYGAKAPLYAFIAGMVGFGATALGSLPGFYLHKLSDKAEDWMLGSSAGMMLAAAIFSLLLPSIETSEKLFTSELAATLWVLFGVFLGVVFLLIINASTEVRIMKVRRSKSKAASGSLFLPSSFTTSRKAWRWAYLFQQKTCRSVCRSRLPLLCRTFRKVWRSYSLFARLTFHARRQWGSECSRV